ncbi:MAG: 4'-phosphopantetheinyl transferase superfamily protein [Candidatus Thiodiazotropha sp.]
MDLTAYFPSGVSLVVADSAMWTLPLRDEEEALVATVLEKRRREFRAGRHAAHTALARLGAPDAPLLRGEKREPLWPVGYVGSIAHCRDLCLAACAAEGEIAGLGVDVEPLQRLPAGVDRYIHTEADTELVQRHSGRLPERLVFCAKESLYKCYYPLVKRYFGFQSVSLTLDAEAGRFGFRPTRDCAIEFPPALDFHGRFLWDDTHLYAFCYLLRRH